MCSGRVGSSCSINGTRGINLVTNPVFKSVHELRHVVYMFCNRNEIIHIDSYIYGTLLRLVCRTMV
jgi:hypothetical protein